MLKYTNYQIGFAEIPEETSLCINISGCPNHCPDCHSKFLWNDSGYDLDEEFLDDILKSKNAEMVTCICFMGGDNDQKRLFELARYVKQNYSNFKTAWYSGKTELNKDGMQCFDYIKVGPYIKEYGSLNIETTNQRLYKIKNNELEDITSKFWL